MIEELLYSIFFLVLSAASYYQWLTSDVRREDPWNIYDRSLKFQFYITALVGAFGTFMALAHGISNLERGSDAELLYSLGFFIVTGITYRFSDSKSPSRDRPLSIIPYYLHFVWICTAAFGSILLIRALLGLFGVE